MGLHVSAVAFWGIAFPDAESPWGPVEAMDAWEGRLATALAERGIDAAEVAGCWILAYGHAEERSVAVVAADSVREAEWTQAAPLGSLVADAAWGQRLRRFCELLDIPWSDPGWWAGARVS